MNRKFLIFSCFFAVSLNSFSQENHFNKTCPDILTVKNINQAIDLALCNNPQTRSTYFSLKAQETIYEQSKSYLYPSINYNFSQNEKTDNKDIRTKQNIQNFNISYLLYDFGYSRNLQLSQELIMEAVALKNESIIQKTIYGVISQYISYNTAIENLNTQNKIYKLLEENLKITSSKYEVGKTIKLDVKQAESQLYNQKLLVQSAQNNSLKQKNKLLISMGIINTDFKKIDSLSLDFFDLPDPPKSLDELYKFALEYNKDLLSSQKELDSLNKQKNAIQAKNYPQINLNYNYNSINQKSPLDIGTNSNTIGITLNIPIFEGGKTYYQQKEYDYKVMQKQEDIQEQKNTLFDNIASIRLDLDTQEQKINTLNVVLEKNRDNYEMALGRYKVGVGTYIDIYNTLQELSKSENDLVSSKNDLNLLKIQLAYTIGNLNNHILSKDK